MDDTYPWRRAVAIWINETLASRAKLSKTNLEIPPLIRTMHLRMSTLPGSVWTHVTGWGPRQFIRSLVSGKCHQCYDHQWYAFGDLHTSPLAKSVPLCFLPMETKCNRFKHRARTCCRHRHKLCKGKGQMFAGSSRKLEKDVYKVDRLNTELKASS